VALRDTNLQLSASLDEETTVLVIFVASVQLQSEFNKFDGCVALRDTKLQLGASLDEETTVLVIFAASVQLQS
jgi:alpha-L-arabinofuranosidase